MADATHLQEYSTGFADDGSRNGSCLLLPINDLHMLVPRNMVAEVIPYSFLKFELDAQTGLERFEWRGRLVPVISSDRPGDLSGAQDNEEAQVAIFYGLKNQKQLPFYSFAITGNPKLLRVSEGDLEELTDVELHPAELMRISLNEHIAFIPKVDHFENIILDLMKQHTGG